MAITWRDVSTNPDIRDKVFLICDIDTSPEEGVPDWITVDGKADAFTAARDGTGGLFLITPASPRIVYASSEGEAGIVADDLESLMTLLVTCPYWQNLLTYSAGGSLAEMRRAAPAIAEAWLGDEEEFAAAREFLTGTLKIAPPPDLIAALHRAVSTPVDVRFHGEPAMPLVGPHTIDGVAFFRQS